MTIKRYNPQKILCDATEHAGVVYTAGQVAEDLTLDVRGQTEQVLKAIDEVLAQAGTDKSKILSATIWVTDIRNREHMNKVWLTWVDPNNLPARATVEAKLADPRMLVEIAVICAK
jgi:enamine deaminase RidA (YjgF/YER057c/UK114 family)